MKLSRRDFFLFSAGGLVGSTTSSRLIQNDPVSPKINSKVYSVASKDYEFIRLKHPSKSSHNNNPDFRRWSMINELDLLTGKTRNKAIPLPNGHDITVIKHNRGACCSGKGPSEDSKLLFIDLNDFSVLASVDPPEGHKFSGHVEVINDLVVAATYPFEDYQNAHPKSSKNGIIQVIDTNTYSIVKSIDSGSPKPHQIKYLASQKTIAISHYGNHQFDNEDSALTSDITKSNISFYSYPDFEVINKVYCNENSSFAHFQNIGGGLVVCPTINYAKANQKGIQLLLQQLENKNEAIRPSVVENGKTGFALPAAIYIIHPKNGLKTKLSLDANHSRGPISLAYNPLVKSCFITFKDSGTLLKLNDDLQTQTFKSELELGLPSYITGVCSIPNQKYIVVTGGAHGALLISAKTLEVIQKFELSSFRGIHAGITPLS